MTVMLKRSISSPAVQGLKSITPHRMPQVIQLPLFPLKAVQLPLFLDGEENRQPLGFPQTCTAEPGQECPQPARKAVQLPLFPPLAVQLVLFPE